MVILNEKLRSISTQCYRAVVREVAKSFATALTGPEKFPPLVITNAEYESGAWAIPIEYRPIVLQITDELILHLQYKLSGAQLRAALLQGAAEANRLRIDGHALPRRERIATRWMPHAKYRRHSSTRSKAAR